MRKVSLHPRREDERRASRGAGHVPSVSTARTTRNFRDQAHHAKRHQWVRTKLSRVRPTPCTTSDLVHSLRCKGLNDRCGDTARCCCFYSLRKRRNRAHVLQLLPLLINRDPLR
ncbi:unnamed protein product, partial [Iphiclides podalirius]